MKIIVYGIGKQYFDIFNNPKSEEREIIKSEVEIIGFADSNSAIWGNEIIYEEKKFAVKSICEFHKNDFEGILVTSKKYFIEIRDFLIQNGYEKERIFLIDKIIGQYLNKLYHIEKFRGKVGIEVGGPSDLFFNIYDNCRACDGVNFCQHTVWWKNDTDDFRYKDKVLGNVFIAEATDLYQIEDGKYDFVLSSNNLEHIANPLKALKEFFRVVKEEGVVLVVVPRKEKTFDHNRDYTTFDHLLEDYSNDRGEEDLSHLPEIIEKHDYGMDAPCGGKEKFIERSKKNVENRCLHHHVFNEECLKKLFAFIGLEVIDFGEVTDNWFIIGQKRNIICNKQFMQGGVV